jgi:hypothetical protein
LGCTGGPVVYRIAAAAADQAPEVLFPTECRDEELPAAAAVAAKPVGTLSERLRSDDAVAWSPDGTQVAFRGGRCDATYDACLTVGTVATGGERVVAAYGGGGREVSGFAAVPAWNAAGTRLAWTAYQVAGGDGESLPVHVVEFDPATGTRRTIGVAEDRELSYLDARRAVVTGRHKASSWVLLVNLATNARVPFHAGSQPTAQPLPR